MKDLPPEIQELIDKNPVLLAVMGLLALQYMSTAGERPKWLKDCPRIHGPKNGAWRGKGSFGTGFGANKVKHK